MLTEIDEGEGVVKMYWADIRKRISKIAPEFAKLVDEISPDKNFPLFLAYYRYGEMVGDSKSQFIPTRAGKPCRLSDNSIPKDLIKHLGYGKNSSPMGMVLEKSFEYFIDLPNQKVAIPWLVYSPGSFFSLANILSLKNEKVYEPNGVLLMTSGARSIFMLPNIGCTVQHVNLQRDFNVQQTAPKSMYDQWNVFKSIINSKTVENTWRSSLIYFSEKWIVKLHNDKAWLKLKSYLLETAWQRFEYERNRVYYDIAFSLIQKNRNLKPNPYLADTARHIFTIALGAAPAYKPSVNENLLPQGLLQKAYVNSYGLKKYLPIIMEPVHYDFQKDNFPVYYSLQNPSTFVFSPKSRKISSTLHEMRELEHIIRIFREELSKDNAMCSDTILNLIAKKIEFNYFHNKTDRHRVIYPTSKILDYDKRFVESATPATKPTFAADAPFVRGCVSIKCGTETSSSSL